VGVVTDESTIARALLWRESDVADQGRLPGAYRRPLARVCFLSRSRPTSEAAAGGGDDFLRETGTLAFVVVHKDRLVYERYLGVASRESL
jgi:hypothetical protein